MFQRWTTCVTTLCLAWVTIGLVEWLSNTPHPLQVAQVYHFAKITNADMDLIVLMAGVHTNDDLTSAVRCLRGSEW